MKVLDIVRAKYERAGLFTQNKAVTLFILSMVLAIGFTLFGVVRLIDRSWATAAGEILVSGVFVFCSVLIWRGCFKASSILTHTLAMVAAIVIFILRAPTGPLLIYMLPTFMFPIYVLVPMIAHSRWQIWLNIAVMIIGESVVYFTHADVVQLADFLIVQVLIIMSSFIVDQLFQVQTKTMKAMEKQTVEAHERTRKFTHLIEGMHEGFDVGQKVLSSAETTQSAAIELLDSVKEMKAALEKTSQLISLDRISSQEIGEAEAALRELNAIQDSAVEKSNTVNRTMTGHINQLAEQASQRVAGASVLVERSSTAGVQMEKTIAKMALINKGAQNILSVISVIEDISARTNLLAMNASIEAAHAGVSGRGFAVVANEIRRLAQESDTNSKAIRGQLEDSFHDLELLSKEGAQLGQVFKVLTEGSRQLSQDIASLGQGLADLSRGSAEILSAVENLQDSGSKVNSSIGRLMDLTQQHRRQIEEIDSHSTDLKARVLTVGEAAQAMEAQAQALSTIGKSNMDQIKHLEKGLENLKD